METSFANGGQLSYSHAEPWANPMALKQIIKWIWRDDAPLKFRFNRDPQMWRWSWSFLASCTHKKSRENTRHTLRLALYSREVLHEIEKDTAVDFFYTKAGILHFYRDEKALDAEMDIAEFQAEHGAPFERFTPEQCIEKSPNLASIKDELAGGVFFPNDESGDIHAFTKNLAEYCTKMPNPVTFHYDHEIDHIELNGSVVSKVVTNHGEFKADKYVMALGAYSMLQLRKMGMYIPIYPMKGYSITVPLRDVDVVPDVSLTDQCEKLVFSHLGEVLRVAGTAEFAGYDHKVNPKRIAGLKRLTEKLYPGCGDLEHIKKWACVRPSTPDGCPTLGNTRFHNLVLNTGHGSLGWTLGPGSGRIAADIVEDKQPEIDITGLTMERF